MYYIYGYFGKNITDSLHQHLLGLTQTFSNGFYREEKNLFMCCTAVMDRLELLSAGHLLFICHSRQYLALASCSKSIPVSAQRTLTLES